MTPQSRLLILPHIPNYIPTECRLKKSCHKSSSTYLSKIDNFGQTKCQNRFHKKYYIIQVCQRSRSFLSFCRHMLYKKNSCWESNLFNKLLSRLHHCRFQCVTGIAYIMSWGMKNPMQTSCGLITHNLTGK